MGGDAIEGGCLCRAVRFAAREIVDAGFCHCGTCRRATGAAVASWVQVSGFRVDAGQPREWEGEGEARGFCDRCGSPLYRRADGTVSVYGGTLDEPARAAPRVHVHVEQQLPWLKMNDLLAGYEGDTPAPAAERRSWRGPRAAVDATARVELRPITRENHKAVVALDIAGGQRRFVAPNAVSLAEAVFAPRAWHRAIYAGQALVGFVMLDVLDEDTDGLPTNGDPFLWRLMIDERYQGLGFGRRAVEAVVAEVRTWQGTRNLWVSAVPGTGSPHAMYTRLGFVDTGKVDDGELILRLALE